MIKIWECGNCNFEAVDMAFYNPRFSVAICPKCKSKDIEISEQKWIKAEEDT